LYIIAIQRISLWYFHIYVPELVHPLYFTPFLKNLTYALSNHLHKISGIHPLTPPMVSCYPSLCPAYSCLHWHYSFLTLLHWLLYLLSILNTQPEYSFKSWSSPKQISKNKLTEYPFGTSLVIHNCPV
jgi:hypothetical protein